MKYPDVLGTQKIALDFVMEHLSKNSLQLPATLTEEEFTNIMKNVVDAMFEAWVEGFLKARE